MTIVAIPRTELPIGSLTPRTAGWWGMIAGIVTEASLFAYLLFCYFYFTIQPRGEMWPAEMPSFKLAGPNTAILLISSVAVWYGERGGRQGSRLKQALGLGTGFVLGVIFVAIQVLEWKAKSFSFNSGPYGSLFFVITGFHMGHVVLGLLMLLPLTIWSMLGYFGPGREAPISIGAIYWHFVDAVWLTVFFSLYITPYLGLSHG
ncbi:cytochrome c oxidase subunit 3 [Bradyrhizobium sp. ORS 285]|uniref:cytochrome c oxidase subunit 3 n=1 Tax=Bradyrhizobium sp. ORS 285 TaxID=115808 RepID=UPI0003152DF2|nr:cytochrome c oxidase subunit 3 [Bradyrhizobium sp. ORS 285]